MNAVAGPASMVPLAARLLSPVKTLVDDGVLTEVDIRSLHLVIAQGAAAPFSMVPCAKMLNSGGPPGHRRRARACVPGLRHDRRRPARPCSLTSTRRRNLLGR